MSELPFRVGYSEPKMVQVMRETAEDAGLPLHDLIRRAELLSHYVELDSSNETPVNSAE